MWPGKSGIVFRREYIERIKSRGFILSTILVPLAIVITVAVPVATTLLLDDDTTRQIAVVNEAGLDLAGLDLPDSVTLESSSLPEDSLKQLVLDRELDGYLLLPASIVENWESIVFVSRGGGGLEFRYELERALTEYVRNEQLNQLGVSDSVVDVLQSSIKIERIRVTEEGEDRDQTGLLSGLGYVMALILYACVFLYGSLVMRSVIEEKTNRVVEVIVSSVKPFQLMLGKVLAVGAVGLTQLLIWSTAMFALLGLIGFALTPDIPAELPQVPGETPGTSPASFVIPDVPVSTFVYFIFFFLGGYLLYASLFASIGSLVDQESDAQQFMLPIAVPIIISLLFLGQVLEAPDSTLSVIFSYIPFFSPILMPVRGLVSPLAVWEMPLALLILVLTFVLAIWLCARIYRVGILMYGKRPTLADVVRWARQA